MQFPGPVLEPRSAALAWVWGSPSAFVRIHRPHTSLPSQNGSRGHVLASCASLCGPGLVLPPLLPALHPPPGDSLLLSQVFVSPPLQDRPGALVTPP